MAGCELGKGVPRLASEIIFRRLGQISWRFVWLTPRYHLVLTTGKQ
jgi:hypothetical protein